MSNTPCVVFEDEDILVIDKPAGLIVHSDGRTEEASVADWILSTYPELASVGEPWLSPQGNTYPRPGIVHRLDRTTSGVMLIAKNNSTYNYLKQQFKDKKVKKVYRAILTGHLTEESGRIEAEIVRTKTIPKKWEALFTKEHNPRAAITDWRVLQKGTCAQNERALSYIDAMPLTGRTHQIRVHMAAIGHPIVGDHLYGTTDDSLLLSRPALHAFSIGFQTQNGEEKYFEAKVPEDMTHILNQLH